MSHTGKLINNKIYLNQEYTETSYNNVYYKTIEQVFIRIISIWGKSIL